MSYISDFKKAQGGKVYCYGLTRPKNIDSKNRYDSILISTFDTANFPKIFKKIDHDLSAMGLCIEPMTPEQWQQARNGIKVEPMKDSLQDNTACLLFGDVESIDGMIKGLQRCKKRLKEKIKEREWEEYRKKYYGKVIRFSDILERKSNAIESLGKVEKPCFQ